MRKLFVLLLIFIFSCQNSNSVKPEILQNGDIIFQTSLSAQSKAIQLATRSKYSHCGIVYKEGDDYYVFEAIQSVKKTPLNKWIARGKNNHYVVKRLKNGLPNEKLTAMKAAGTKMVGKNYDLYFEWSNDRIYCSELIWKIYNAAGIELCPTEQLQDFDLSQPAVKQKLKERYGDNIPLQEKVVSPAALFNSDLLETIE